MNLYGFNRLTRGEDASGYYHEFFLRDREFLARRMMRQVRVVVVAVVALVVVVVAVI